MSTGVKDNDFGPPSESNLDGSAEEANESTSNDRSSNGDAIVGSIRYVSCSVAGSDPLEQPKDNENEGIFWANISFCDSSFCCFSYCKSVIARFLLTVFLRFSFSFRCGVLLWESSLSAYVVQAEGLGGRYPSYCSSINVKISYICNFELVVT